MDCDKEYLSNSRVDEKPSPGRFVFVEVTDTGIGMSNETIQRLFDPFFTTKFTGRGLGMSAVLGILRGHGGAIMVYSEPERGTTIKALFPALEGALPENAVEKTESVPLPGLLTPEEGAQNHMVLIVDDEEGVRSFCQKALGIFGYRTLSAADGMEAVAVYKAHADEIDCVLMDLTMPKMDGAATIEALWKINPGLRIILSSGFSEQEATRRFVDKDLAGFIQKPYDLKRLRDTLQKAFGE
jgi:CheY-like chemotaxis protein